MKCMVSSCNSDNKGKSSKISFFSFPKNAVLLERWIQFIGRRDFNPLTSVICIKHFTPDDILNRKAYDLGLVRRRHLKRSAVPTILVAPQQVERETSAQLSATEDTFENAGFRDLKTSSSHVSRKISTKTEALINEALFDHEEVSNQEIVSLTADNDKEVSPIRSSIDVKSEIDSVSTSDEIHHLNNQSFSASFLSKCIQTDEAAEDRINCGFVNVSKSGTDKYFNLRCFYCDAEYPISFWSEFSDHILYDHGHLEKVFNKNNELESTTSENSLMHDADSTQQFLEEEISSINYINLDEIGDNDVKVSTKKKKKEKKCEIKSMETLSKNSNTPDATEPYAMYDDNYVPTYDHNYSQAGVNKWTHTMSLDDVSQSKDEINFDKTPRYIVLDFLDHLKGFPSLWRNRMIDCEQFDKDLAKLMKIINLKWDLNLDTSLLYKNLESIKAWFNRVREAKENSNQNNFQYLFGEYYEKCAELAIFENASKHNLIRCDLCNRGSDSAFKFQSHKFRRHGVGQLPYGCNKCDKRFTYIEMLLSHIRNHKRKTEDKNKRIEKLIRMASNPKNEPPPPSPTPPTYECFQCNKQFSSENEYKLHLDIHPKGDCPFGCEECGARYKNINSMRAHKKAAHTSKVHQCNICQLRTTTAYGLKIHMDAHNGVYKYVCEWCGKKFVCRKYWNEHCLFEHFGYGKCKICNREYKKRTILQKHLRTLHRPLFGTNEELSKPFEMKLRCGSLRGSKGGNLKLRKYEYVIDPVTKKRRLKCPKCDENFHSYNSVLRHALQTHNYDCRTMVRGEREGAYRPRKVQKPLEQKRKKYYWNRLVKIVDNKPIYIDSDDLEANSEVEEEINASREYVNSQFEQLDYTSGDGGSGDNNVFETNEIENGNTTIEISFEKFADEINTNNNYPAQSANDLDALIANDEDLECSSYFLESCE